MLARSNSFLRALLLFRLDASCTLGTDTFVILPVLFLALRAAVRGVTTRATEDVCVMEPLLAARASARLVLVKGLLNFIII